MSYSSIGILEYGPNINRVILRIDQGIVDYYKALIPKSYRLNPQYYDAHISVVRKEEVNNLGMWMYYHGEEVEFQYDSEIYIGNVYCHLNAYSERLKKIRNTLGLGDYRVGFNCFHITLANFKELKNGNNSKTSFNI